MSETHPFFDGSLLARLPKTRGKISACAPLKEGAWLRVGGPAEILFRPMDALDLASFLKDCPEDVPITVLGAASNILIRDGGVEGVVIRLGPRFAACTCEDDLVVAGASAIDLNVSRTARDAGLAGLEFLCGIPGTIGGAIAMNAGAYGSEIGNVLLDIELVTREGEIRTYAREALGLSYRRSDLPEGAIVLKARFKGTKDSPDSIDARMRKILEDRGEAQPVHANTGGSTFANPDGHKAWKLIDEAGCRGLRIGGAVMSEKHCNFMINEGSATAADLEALGEEVRKRVKEKSGIELRWEIRRIGKPLTESKNS